MPAKLALADRLCGDVSALTPGDLAASTADIMQIASIWQDPVCWLLLLRGVMGWGVGGSVAARANGVSVCACACVSMYLSVYEGVWCPLSTGW